MIKSYLVLCKLTEIFDFEPYFTNLGAPSATNTLKDLLFSFAVHKNSSTVLELPKVKMTSL